MIDWAYLNSHRIRSGAFASVDEDGFNGAFILRVNGVGVKIIASDGEGWEHVSVSLIGSTMTPSWDMMAKIKDLFWDPEVAVIQIHPPHSQYVNFHPGCLHLWRCLNRITPLPPWYLVGPKQDVDKESAPS